MAQYYTNFTEETYGEISGSAKNWVRRSGPATRSHQILPTPEQRLVIDAGSTAGSSLLGFKPTKDYDYANTIESLTLFSVDTPTQVPGSYGIVYHDYNGTQGYSVAFLPASNVKSLFLYDDKNQVTVTYTNYNWAVGTKYWLRYRQENTNHYIKIWADGSPEPASWTLSATYNIGAISGTTYTGLGTYSSNHQVNYYKFALGTNGDAAIPEAPVTGTYYNGYKYRKPITIDKSKVSAFGGFYRMLLLHTDPDLRSVANGGKVELDPLTDIRFENDKGVKYPHEIVDYNPATGAIEAWVRLGEDTTSQPLSTTVNTSFYVYFGKKLSADTFHGVPIGYKSGFVAFQRNWDRATNTENQGEMSPFISSMTGPNGETITAPNDLMITGKEDGALVSGFIMYTEEVASTRFGTGTSWNDRLVFVYHDGTNWYMDRNGEATIQFTPRSSDFLVAAVSWGGSPAGGRSVNYVGPLPAGEELPWATWGIIWSDDINVVGNTHRAVFHLNETPTGGSWVNNIDSSDRFSMNMSGSGGPTSVAGKVGRAIAFNGVNQKLRAPADVIWSTLGHGYISAWVKLDNLSHNGAVFARRSSAGASDQLTIFILGGYVRFDNGTFQWDTGYLLPSAGQWYHIVWISNGSQHKLMVNGVVRATRNTTDAFSGATGYNRAQLGASQTNADADGNWLTGAIDEFVIDTDNKADGFHVTTYNNQNNPATFYSLGALESAVIITDRNQSGNARISLITSRDQTGVTRITKVVSRDQQGNVRITRSESRLQLGNTRILAVVTRNTTGNLRVQTVPARDQTGRTRIQQQVIANQLGNISIRKTQDRLQSGNTRVQRQTTRTQQGSALVESPYIAYFQEQPGRVSIRKDTTRTNLGRMLVQRQEQSAQTGRTRIQRIIESPIQGDVRIERTEPRDQLGNASIFKDKDKHQQGNARIELITLRTLLANTRISKTASYTQLGRVRITIETLRSISGNLSVKRQPLRDQPASVLIAKEMLADQLGSAYIIRVNEYADVPRIGIRPQVGGQPNMVDGRGVTDINVAKSRTGRVAERPRTSVVNTRPRARQ